jgi:hypothetical protein
MSRIFAQMVLLCALSAGLFLACGQDEMERGVPDSVDAATPIDPEQLEMTEEERRKKDDV